MIAQLSAEQENAGLLICWSQFGENLANFSVSQARENLSENEFGLGLEEILPMLWTHPERLFGDSALGIILLGNEFDNDAMALQKTERTLYLCAMGRYSEPKFGSVTAFLS